jgi:hypothetical protein
MVALGLADTCGGAALYVRHNETALNGHRANGRRAAPELGHEYQTDMALKDDGLPASR